MWGTQVLASFLSILDICSHAPPEIMVPLLHIDVMRNTDVNLDDRLSDVSMPPRRPTALAYHVSFTRFLYADPTPSALQVFVKNPGEIMPKEPSDLPAEEGDEQGMWLNVNPIPGCVVCNIGESKWYP
jgi:hypothetical protein